MIPALWSIIIDQSPVTDIWRRCVTLLFRSSKIGQEANCFRRMCRWSCHWCWQATRWRHCRSYWPCTQLRTRLQIPYIYIYTYTPIQGLHWQLWKVAYYISGSITHKFLKSLYLDYHSWTYIIFNIILVHLIFEMPPIKNHTFSHQQNIWIVTNYGLQLWKSNG